MTGKSESCCTALRCRTRLRDGQGNQWIHPKTGDVERYCARCWAKACLNPDRVVCSWCLKEGKPGILKDGNGPVVSHGICKDHLKKEMDKF